MMFKLLMLSFIAMAIFVPSVSGQITYEGCRDARGIPVASVPGNVNDVAVASLAPNGAPIVQYNPEVLRFFHPETRRFYDLEQLWSDAEKIEYHNL